jgi:phage tail protein X
MSLLGNSGVAFTSCVSAALIATVLTAAHCAAATEANTAAKADSNAHRIVLMPRASLALSKAELIAHVDAASRAGATDLLIDIWDHGTVPYTGSNFANADSAIAAADPVATLARAARDAHLRTWLWLSGGFEVWQTPLSAPIDPGPFLRAHQGWAAVTRDGTPGVPDSTAGVRRYTMTPSLRDVHQYLFGIIEEALGRYPVEGVVVDRIEYPSEEYSYDPQANQTFIQVGAGVDPRGLTPADTAAFMEWRTWRKEQMRAFTHGLVRRLNRRVPPILVAAFAVPAAERETHLQDWPFWANPPRAENAVRWLCFRVHGHTAAEVESTLKGTPEEADGMPWGVAPDTSLTPEEAGVVVHAVTAMGGSVCAISDASLVRNPDAWKSVWLPADTTPTPAPAPTRSQQKPKTKRAGGKK